MFKIAKSQPPWNVWFVSSPPRDFKNDSSVMHQQSAKRVAVGLVLLISPALICILFSVAAVADRSSVSSMIILNAIQIAVVEFAVVFHSSFNGCRFRIKLSLIMSLFPTKVVYYCVCLALVITV